MIKIIEEVGLQPKDVKVLYASKHWLRYKLPKRLLRYDSKPIVYWAKTTLVFVAISG